MSILAGKTQLNFEPKMPVALDTVATTSTPDAMATEIGPLVALNYRPARFQFLGRLDAQATQGEAVVKLTAGSTIVYSQTIALNGVTQFSNDVGVDLSGVNGETVLKTEVEVTSAANAGRTLQLDSRVEISVPGISTGC
ncbi:hypothetical protein [Marinobacter alkaliphilus]|uniref:hypothetical protein n=1 Tax=Marinobacter alkaliphilus TaxID=254719 RepID=UPI003D76A0ED